MSATPQNLADQELDADEEPTRATEAELETDADENSDDFLLAWTVAAVIEIAVMEASQYEEAINGTKKRKRV